MPNTLFYLDIVKLSFVFGLDFDGIFDIYSFNFLLFRKSFPNFLSKILPPSPPYSLPPPLPPAKKKKKKLRILYKCTPYTFYIYIVIVNCNIQFGSGNITQLQRFSLILFCIFFKNVEVTYCFALKFGLLLNHLKICLLIHFFGHFSFH